MGMSDINSAKPKRPYSKLVKSLYQVLKIDTNLKEPFWYHGESECGELSQRRLRLGVWNIFKGNGGEHFMNDYRQFLMDLDLVLIQEALVSNHSLKSLHIPGFAMIHCGSYQRMDGLRDGVMTLSRLSHLDEPKRVRSLYVEPVFGTPKVSLISTYRLSEHKTLLVANVHSTLFRSLGRAREEIDQLIAKISVHKGPMIVAGDFNTFQNRYLVHLQDCLWQLGVKIANIPQDPRKKDAERLDHIFVRDLTLERAKVEKRLVSSDHYPLKAILSF